jgi:hypothetical protein
MPIGKSLEESPLRALLGFLFLPAVQGCSSITPRGAQEETVAMEATP